MDADTLKTYIEIGMVLWNVALTAAHFMRKPGEDAGKAVGELRTAMTAEIGELKDRLIKVETNVEHMPTSEELAKLEGTVKQIDERTEGLSEGMSTVRNQLNRIENFLLTSKQQ